jgi:predicted DNA-binding transcriptional regulator AlpA
MLPDPADRPCVSADEAFAELGIDRTTGYRAIKEGTFPLPVIRVGRLIRISTAALRHLLTTGVPPAGDATYDGGSSAVERTTQLTSRPVQAHRAPLYEERPEAREA